MSCTWLPCPAPARHSDALHLAPKTHTCSWLPCPAPGSYALHLAPVPCNRSWLLCPAPAAGPHALQLAPMPRTWLVYSAPGSYIMHYAPIPCILSLKHGSCFDTKNMLLQHCKLEKTALVSNHQPCLDAKLWQAPTSTELLNTQPDVMIQVIGTC